MDFNEFLQNYGLYLALVVFSVIVFLLFLFLVVPRLRKEDTQDTTPQLLKSEFITLLGGETNITEINLRGSRLSVSLVNKELANVEELKKHGVSRVVVMQNKLVLLVDESLQNLFNKLS